METFFFLFEIIGTVAFAISGAMTALKKNMDIFGVAILGLTTAVGGGALRDIVLGITPPTMFREPVYGLLAVLVSVAVFIPGVRKLLMKNPLLYERILLCMDALGLGVFTVVGICTAVAVGERGVFLLLFVGMVTGVGGGVLRDLFSGNTPLIFVKHFYACASGAGAILCILLLPFFGQTAAALTGALAVFVLRLLAAHFKWSLPRAGE